MGGVAMIAIGFLLFVLGFVLVRFFGVPYIEYVFTKAANEADYVGVVLSIVGFALLIVGLTKYLWDVFP
jgi:uncharacterized membrane protein